LEKACKGTANKFNLLFFHLGLTHNLIFKPQKPNIMKKIFYLFVVIVFTAGLFVSCTLESLDSNDQQIDPHEIQVPRQG
jgi:hypothetical protein